MPSIFARNKSLVAQEEGATMVEYGLMVGLIAIVCAVVLRSLGISLRMIFIRVFLTLIFGEPF